MTTPWEVTTECNGDTLTIKVRGVMHSCPKCGAPICPVCGGELVQGRIPCPDKKPGCLVLHYGLRCSACGVVIDGRPR